MRPVEAILAVLNLVEEAEVPYLTVGALATGAYGIPRDTHDADFVLAIDGLALDEIFKRLPADIIIDPQSRAELFTGTYRWVLRIARSTFEIETFLLGTDPHHLVMFERKRQAFVPMIQRDAWVPAPEDLVIQKLRWARRKDLDDILNVLAVQGRAIDYDWIEDWCRQHGTLEKLHAVRAELPPDL